MKKMLKNRENGKAWLLAAALLLVSATACGRQTAAGTVPPAESTAAESEADAGGSSAETAGTKSAADADGSGTSGNGTAAAGTGKTETTAEKMTDAENGTAAGETTASESETNASKAAAAETGATADDTTAAGTTAAESGMTASGAAAGETTAETAATETETNTETAAAGTDPAETTAPAAETETAPPETAAETAAPPAASGYDFVYNGTVIAMGTAALGEPESTFEQDSCAYQGKDIVYSYPGFELSTYPLDGTETIASVYFLDDTVATAEGIRIGSSDADVTAAYAGRYEVEFDVYRMADDKTELIIYVTDHAVDAVEYLTLTDGL